MTSRSNVITKGLIAHEALGWLPLSNPRHPVGHPGIVGFAEMSGTHRTCSARDRHGLPLANIHDSLCTRDTGVVLEIAR